MKSCLICDDHALVREAIAGAIHMSWPEANVVEAVDFPAAWKLAAQGHDLCIADLVMPGADPLSGIRRLRELAPDLPILIVTGTEDDALLLDLLDLGVAGFAPKSARGAVIEAACRLILAGGRFLPERVAEIAAARVDRDDLPADAAQRVAATAEPGDRLTDRQIEVLRLVARGYSNKEIARALALAPSTVKTHLAHIQASLGAHNRTEASILAQMLKII